MENENIIKEVINIIKDKIVINNHKENLEKLLYERDNVEKKLLEIEKFISINNVNLIRECHNSVNGHDIYLETESGPYGKTWRVCYICGYEY